MENGPDGQAGMETFGMQAGTVIAEGSIYNYVIAYAAPPLGNWIITLVGIIIALAISCPSEIAFYRSRHPPGIVMQPFQPFVGREKLLDDIEAALKNSSNSSHWSGRMVALVGFAGMGKTDLAREFATDHRDDYNFIGWINAETEGSTEWSFKTIARSLGLNLSPEMQGTEIADRVFQSIGDRPSLFIYDNANQLQTSAGKFGIFHYLPRKNYQNPPFVLLTSRTKDWGKEFRIIEVEELSQDDCLEFFQYRFRLSTETLLEDTELNNSLNEMCRKLQGYPFGLSLAAACVNYIPWQTHISLLRSDLRDCTDKFDIQIDSSIWNKQVNESMSTDYPHSLETVWSSTVESLKSSPDGANAMKLLIIMASFDPYITEVEYLGHFHEYRKPTDQLLDSSDSFNRVEDTSNRFDFIQTHFRANAPPVKAVQATELAHQLLYEDPSVLQAVETLKKFSLIKTYDDEELGKSIRIRPIVRALLAGRDDAYEARLKWTVLTEAYYLLVRIWGLSMYIKDIYAFLFPQLWVGISWGRDFIQWLQGTLFG